MGKKVLFFSSLLFLTLILGCKNKSASKTTPGVNSTAIPINDKIVSKNESPTQIELNRIEANCASDNYFVISEDAYSVQQVKKVSGCVAKAIMANNLKQAGYASLSMYQGDGLPESKYIDVSLLFKDSISAAIAHEKLSGTELMKDSEGYYSFQWMLSGVAIVNKESLDSLKSAIKGMTINFDDIITDDATCFVVFASCQSLESAQTISNTINSSGCKTNVLQLTRIEEDM